MLSVVRFAAASAMLACTLSTLHAEPSATWSQWRGPARDGQLPGAQWPQQLDGLEIVWEKSHSPTYSGPIVTGDLLFTTETIDKKSERVTAYQLDSGAVKWTAEWPGAMAVPFFAASNGDWIRSTPACTPSHLVVVGMRDVMVCLDPQSGQENWRVDFPEDMKTPMPSFGAVCSPLIDGGSVYVQSGGALVKLDVETGKVIWKTLENGSGMMSSGAFSSPVIATIAGERQLVVATRMELCGVRLDDGGVLWRTPIKSFRGMNILTPLVIGDRVFTAAHSGTAQLFDISNSKDQWNANEVWSQKVQGYMSSPVRIDDTIYLHMKNQRVCALSADDGSIRWTSSPFGKYWSMVSNGKQILALDNSGELLLIESDHDALKIVSKKKVADNSWAHLAVQGDKVIIRDLKALKVYQWK